MHENITTYPHQKHAEPFKDKARSVLHTTQSVSAACYFIKSPNIIKLFTYVFPVYLITILFQTCKSRPVLSKQTSIHSFPAYRTVTIGFRTARNGNEQRKYTQYEQYPFHNVLSFFFHSLSLKHSLIDFKDMSYTCKDIQKKLACAFFLF